MDSRKRPNVANNLPANLLALRSKATIQAAVFRILEDRKWHCRGCGYSGVESGQLAGGGGIQGLQRGTGSRPGLVIISESKVCHSCKKRLVHDRWTGETKQANSTSNITPKLAERILKHLKYTDEIEQRKRQSHELIIDHRFPMERWGANEEKTIQRCLKRKSNGSFNCLRRILAAIITY
jgi:hypothetical protein